MYIIYPFLLIFLFPSLSAQSTTDPFEKTDSFLNCLDDLEGSSTYYTHRQKENKEENAILVFLELQGDELRATGWVSLYTPEKMVREAMDFGVFGSNFWGMLDEECSEKVVTDKTIVVPLHIPNPLSYHNGGVNIFRENDAARRLIIKYVDNPHFHVTKTIDYGWLLLDLHDRFLDATKKARSVKIGTIGDKGLD